MIRIRPGVRIWARAQPTDLRKGFAGLAGLVHQEMQHDLLDGDLFLFLSRSRSAIKLLQWDGTGLCIYSKRLAKGRFAHIWSSRQQDAFRLTRKELAQLIQGADITRKPKWRK